MNHIPFEFSQITDEIFIGTNACCSTHFDERLLAIGIRADISLEAKRIDQPFGVQFYLWLPVKDHQAPSLDQLKIGVDVLNDLIKMKKKVYVHCEKGHGRAPTLVAAYLIKKGKTVREAIKFIKSKRPTIHLEKTQLGSLNKFRKRHAKYERKN